MDPVAGGEVRPDDGRRGTPAGDLEPEVVELRDQAADGLEELGLEDAPGGAALGRRRVVGD